jgi:chemotaxis protein histidine kinase CheA
MAETVNETIKIKVEFVTDTTQATDGAEKVNNAVKDVTKSQKDSIETFGIMDTKIGKMAKGIVDFGAKGVKAMLSLKGAIVSTGIGALVIAVVSLIQYFTKTERGAEQLKVVMAALGQVLAIVTDTFIKIGETLFKIGQIIVNVVKGTKTFKEGWSDAKDVVTDAIDDVKDSYDGMNESIQKSMDLAKRENELRRARRENLVEEAKLSVELSQIREQIENKDIAAEERLKLLNEGQRIQNELSDEQVRIAREAYEIKKEQNALSESTAEDLDEEAQLLANLILIEKDRADKQKEFTTKRISIENEIQAAIDATTKAEQDAADEAEKIRQQRLIQTKSYADQVDLMLLEGREQQLEQLQQWYDAELEKIGDNEEAKSELLTLFILKRDKIEADAAQAAQEARDKAAQDEIEKEKAKRDALAAINMSRANNVMALGSLIQNIAGKSKELAMAGLIIEKAAAVAKIFQSTAVANAQAVAAMPLTAGMPWVAINTATAGISIASIVAETAKGIQQINSTNVKKKALGGWLSGQSHENGGVPFIGEDGEFLVNKRTMSNPYMAKTIRT